MHFCNQNSAETSSEYYQNGEFSDGPTLPIRMSSHCVVEVEPGFVFVSGNANRADAKTAMAFEPATGTFQVLADMTKGRQSHGCGVVKKGDS